jgi:hypothetical protein
MAIGAGTGLDKNEKPGARTGGGRDRMLRGITGCR